MRTALYARVSTSDQSTEMQLAALRQYAERRGWSVSQEHVDQGFQGRENADQHSIGSWPRLGGRRLERSSSSASTGLLAQSLTSPERWTSSGP